jgi:hypothetical protein
MKNTIKLIGRKIRACKEQLSQGIDKYRQQHKEASERTRIAKMSYMVVGNSCDLQIKAWNQEKINKIKKQGSL